MASRTLNHYKKLLASNPGATVGFTLAAQAVYASRHGEFDPNAEDHNDDAYRAIARTLKRKYGENLTRAQVETEMEMAGRASTTEMRIRNVPTAWHTALRHIAADERLSLNSLMVHLIARAVRESKYQAEYIQTWETDDKPAN